jgi:hypothetical protein
VALDIPDGETIIVYEVPGYDSQHVSGRMGVADANGNKTSLILEPWFADGYPRIDTVRFANGWYYIIGAVTLRTRDFENFESVTPPGAHPIIEVLEFNGNLFAFTREAAYKMTDTDFLGMEDHHE